VTSLSAVLVTAREPVIPFPGTDGRVTATYEVEVRNVTPFPLTPTWAEVRAPDGRVLQRMGRSAVSSAVALPSKRGGVKVLAEGQIGVLYLTVPFASRDAVPAQLDTVVSVTGLPGGATYTSDAVAVPVSSLTPPVVGPPLENGTRYIAADSCCDSPRHRRAMLPMANGQWLAQRFAVDWEQLDARNRTVSRGDPSDPAAYTVYGKKVIAASDGTVVHVIEDQPDQKPGSLPAGLTPAQADGNSVVLDMGGGLYALYAHLQKDSVAVQEGQTVRRGQQLGLVGNSGNSSAPHLHFHVMDGPSPMTSEGVPYVIDAFTTTGRITDQEAFDTLENTTKPLPTRRLDTDGPQRNVMPLNLDLVTFG
jgi:biotin carboxyl carrier protein